MGTEPFITVTYRAEDIVYKGSRMFLRTHLKRTVARSEWYLDDKGDVWYDHWSPNYQVEPIIPIDPEMGVADYELARGRDNTGRD